MKDTQRNRKSANEVQMAFGKTDARYWKTRVKMAEGWNFYGVQIQHSNERHFLALGTANKDQAATRAAKLFLRVKSEGWKPILAEERPEAVRQIATVGAYIEKAEEVANLEPRTINEYKKALRRLVSEVKGINGTGRYDWRSGKAEQWRNKVDAVRLDAITPASVQKWKKRKLSEVADDPARQRATKNTINGVIRNAKSLFGRKVLPHVAKELEVPDPHPLKEVELFPRQSMRYSSKIDAAKVIALAQARLGAPRRNDETEREASNRHEQLKILLLALFAGLRFNEIDKLLWRQVDFERSLIRIEATEYFRPKTEEAAGDVPIDPELVATLRGWKARATGQFVIEAQRKARPSAGWNSYRARTNHKHLLDWLRALEIDGETPLAKVQKPIHELRKEAGSLINERFGIHAASVFLRHSDTRITAAHYLDGKRGITTGLGSLLSGGNVEHFPAEGSEEAAS